jgi:5-methyltetrahydrofolate--homocysteine methyltransferase
VAAGADLLDVNVGAAGVDEASALRSAVLALVASCDAPLVLDSSDAGALEAALRVYPGRALVNSVNGDPASLEAVLPLAARYGAAVIALALNDAGIPPDAAGRLAIVERVREAAQRAGLRDGDLVVDSLVMTAAADATAPATTLDTLRQVATGGLATVLGVSNVSHGLPRRPLLNAAFFAAAAAAGLDAAIANPNDHVVMGAVRLANQARAAGVDPDAHRDAWDAWQAAYASALVAAQEKLAAASRGADSGAASGATASHETVVDPATALETAVIRGDSDAAPTLVDDVVSAGMPPSEVIAGVLTPAIQRLGDAYGRGEVFLPQLMVAAEAMKAAVERVKARLPEGESVSRGTVAFATVKGDIHSIGKDICVSMLESQGFEVNDLGVDVPLGRLVEAARTCDAVCLSALMTTTLREMAASVAAISAAQPALPVLVGGAVVTAEWARSVGAGYAADAPGCVRAVEAALIGSTRSEDAR